MVAGSCPDSVMSLERCEGTKQLTTDPAVFVYRCAKERCGRGHLILSVLQVVQQAFRK